MISCILENGKQILLRHVTVDAIAVKDNKLLLIKRSTDSIEEPGKYALPGGYLDRDENPTTGVIRELKEETGYEGSNAVLLRLNASPNRKGGDRQSVDLVFTVNVGEKVSEPDLEVTEVKWFDLNQLPAEEDFAFDHYESIQLYLKHLKDRTLLPILNV